MNKQVELYEMLMELLKAEEKCRNEVRDSQNEVSLHHMSLNSTWNIGKCPEFFLQCLMLSDTEMERFESIPSFLSVDTSLSTLVNTVFFPKIIPRLIIFTEFVFTRNEILTILWKIH